MSRVCFRTALVAGVLAMTAAEPASAQFYLKSRVMSGDPVQGDEPGIMMPLPGATAAEQRAGLVWTMRAALNLAALQCDFEATLQTRSQYNALLIDHKAELAAALDTLNKYFVRMNHKNAKLGAAAFDHYQTQTWSSFSVVAAQLNFCQTADAVGRMAVFAPRGQLGFVAVQRMRELRNSQVPSGEQMFQQTYFAMLPMEMPRLDPICWSGKKESWNFKKCGNPNWPPAGTGVAAEPASAGPTAYASVSTGAKRDAP